jgi:T-complex protein 1 subunit theta
MVDLLKEGTKHLTGAEEAVLKDCEAGNKLALITRTSLGPNGMNKMIVNHLEKLFVTSDAATILKELEVQHPAAKMVVLAAQQQEAEIGDGTNLVVILAGELLYQAMGLLRMGLHPSLIVQGYTLAGEQALKILDAALAAPASLDPKDEGKVSQALRAAIAAKQYGYDDILAPLVARACISALPAQQPASSFSVDNVRVAKILGGGVSDSCIVRGFVIPRDAEGSIKHVKRAVLAVYAGGFDLPKTETKGTVLVKSAKELVEYNAGEEQLMESTVRELAEAGVNVVVSGSSVGELALHFLERYKIMLIKVLSKFDLRRLCNAVGASPLLSLGAPQKNKLGHCDVVTVDEIGSTRCTVFRQDSASGELATIIVRASTQNLLDDIERAIDDGVNVYKQLCKDPKFLPGAGAAEIDLAIKLSSFAEAQPGLEQYAMKKYAEAFEIIPRTLAENAGLNASQVVSDLYAAHAAGRSSAGVDIEAPVGGGVCDAAEHGILDHGATKRAAIEFATNAAVTILRVDQIIMQKPAGGPKVPKSGGAMDAGDPDLA